MQFPIKWWVMKIEGIKYLVILILSGKAKLSMASCFFIFLYIHSDDFICRHTRQTVRRRRLAFCQNWAFRCFQNYQLEWQVSYIALVFVFELALAKLQSFSDAFLQQLIHTREPETQTWSHWRRWRNSGMKTSKEWSLKNEIFEAN